MDRTIWLLSFFETDKFSPVVKTGDWLVAQVPVLVSDCLGQLSKRATGGRTGPSTSQRLP